MNKRTWSSSLRKPSLQLSPNQRQATRPRPFPPSLLSGLDRDQPASQTAQSLCGDPIKAYISAISPLVSFLSLGLHSLSTTLSPSLLIGGVSLSSSCLLA